MSKKLGHITGVENRKVNEALEAARGTCSGELSEDRKFACKRAIVIARSELKKRGFKTDFHSLSGASMGSPATDDVHAAVARTVRFCKKIRDPQCQKVCYTALRVVSHNLKRDP